MLDQIASIVLLNVTIAFGYYLVDLFTHVFILIIKCILKVKKVMEYTEF